MIRRATSNVKEILGGHRSGGKRAHCEEIGLHFSSRDVCVLVEVAGHGVTALFPEEIGVIIKAGQSTILKIMNICAFLLDSV